MQNLRPNLFGGQHQLQSESPQIYRERQSHGSEFQHISPIPTLSIGSSDCNSQNTNEKIHGRIQFLSGQNVLNNQHSQNLHQQFLEMESPNTLAKEFYRKPQQIKEVKENDFYFESYDDSQGMISEVPEVTTAIKYGYENQYLQSNGGGKTQKQLGSAKENCTDFDLTAKEISSNKRGAASGGLSSVGAFDKKIQKNTIISGRTSHSPMDGVQSNSETVKWAFSNKDSQETQKKVSIINRESMNTQDIISRSLKSHDSRTQIQQQTNSSQQVAGIVIKGKMLDFGNLDPSSHNLESGLFYSNNKNAHQQILTGGTDASQFDNQEEQKVVSFLENEDEILMSSLKKKPQNTIAQTYKKQVKKQAATCKFMPHLKHSTKVNEFLKSLIDNTIECIFCHEQKVFDSSLNCSKLDGPKGTTDIIRENLEKKYLTSREYYNVKIINDIIYNESTHIVSVFKDYLIFDDISEFLKRFYQKIEGIQRLPKMFEFYEKYSKVFPNYVILPENKYLFKNIEKKQRIIDDKQRYLMEQQEKKQIPAEDFKLGGSGDKQRNRHRDRFSSQQQNSSNMSYTSNNRMFDTHFINSVANINPSGFIDSMVSSRINNSQFHDHVVNSSILIHQQLQQNMDNHKAQQKKKKGLHELDIDELISKFIAKDSESNIQQSTIMLQSQIEENIPQNNDIKPLIAVATAPEKKKQVYEYKEKKVQQPQSLLQSDNSKSQNDNTNSVVARPSSGKLSQNLETTNKRLSSGSNQQNQKSANASDQTSKKPNDQQTTKDGKVLSYNIYNNYNQYINNENYYINADKINTKIVTNEPPQQQITAAGTSGSANNNGSRQGSLQRNQSKGNLHSNPAGASVKQNENCSTPLKNGQQRDIVTPKSGGADVIAEKKLQNIQSKYIRDKDLPEKIAPLETPITNLMISQTNRSGTSLQKSDNQISASPINNTYGQKTKAFTSTLNTCRANTEALVSRELSKEKRPSQNQQQYQVVPNQKQFQNTQTNLGSGQQNQMFKNEFIINIANRLSDQQQQQQIQLQQQEYNTVQPNVRTIERLKNIEDEIEKDYSKYVNEYGLTKTAFAKAVNQIREKQLKITNVPQSQQPAQSQPTTTRQTRLANNSNEKKRMGSNNPRSGSTSQQRKGSTQRQQNQKINTQGQENINDLYMNTNSVRGDQSKQIRSVRTKTHLSSQNSSSCFQRSQKLSPDKGYIITNQFQAGFNQSNATQLNQTPSSGYITLKAQPMKQSKGIKIKFPLNQQQKENVYQSAVPVQNNQNTSQNQTPKRIKLQKTKSTSNIPMQFTQRGFQQPATTNTILSTSRGRHGGIPEMVIMDELSQQMSINNGLLTSNMRGSQHQNFNEPQLNAEGQMIQSMLFPQGTFQSNSCLGTFATTSILNSPLSFKNQAYQPVLNNQRQESKGRQSSRNGTNSQHQSQKSINGTHQRASSSNNLLQISNSKIKAKGGESKRMSAGSNLSKKVQSSQNIHHQPSQSNIQQQILQLLMSYQNQEAGAGGDLTSTSSIQQYLPFQNTLKSMNFNNQNNTQSMKDLKSMKQPTTLMKDIQIIKAPKQKIATTTQVNNNLQSQQQSMNTQRQGQSNTGSILMLNQNFKKSARTGKNTQRGDSKKRVVQQNIINPYQPNNDGSNYTQMQTTHNNELSSRIQSALNGDSNGTIGMQSQIDHAKKILSYSKSQENLDLIKFAAQRAAIEQQQQQMLQSQYQQQQIQNLPTAKFLQNLKPTDTSSSTNNNMISLSKIKLIPSSSNQALLSARNMQQQQFQQQQQQFDPSQYRSNNSEYENQQQMNNPNIIQQSKNLNNNNNGPTNIIIGSNFDRPQSRRTSGKFNPSSTKSQQQQ